MAKVTFNKISKVYPGNVKAVKDFTFKIEDKEFVVFVGPSGCGKSTTLRMVAGLEEITGGKLHIDDKLVNEVPPKKRDIAMVFQNYALYPHMSVYDNMAFGLKLRKVKKIEINKRVEEAAKILGIEELLNRKPKALSGGQRQRVALGRAIVREPKVFLMDEPLSNLDAKLRVQMRTEIVKLHKRLQTTFIYVTHDQTEAMTMGDRIVVMKDGIMQQADAPQKVYQQPANMFVAGFIGSPQMNFIDVEVTSEDDNYYLTFGTMKIRLPEDKGKIINEKDDCKKIAVMGIRPENIYNRESKLEQYKDTLITGIVEVKEMLGSETYLYVNVEGNSIIARVDRGNDLNHGDNINLVIDPEKLHLFDKESGVTIF
ncbi:ABC transporter ATP-binding protein [Dethiothermospora halolimnae]|uniref:ABC transporter ATP-binding protein n=1 Tax=Dethiothermospora halolimnae TaxID=3114390 RepID=UPI003CCBF715